MSKEIKTTVYTYKELNDKAKQKAREWFYEASSNDDWHESVYEDAERVGLKITSFDTGRGSDITGEFIDGALNCMNTIFKEHGETCETYKTAKAYEEAIDALPEMPEPFDNENQAHWNIETEIGDRSDEAESEFLKSLLQDYLKDLREEYEYRSSDEYLEESILANDYTFTETGKRFG